MLAVFAQSLTEPLVSSGEIYIPVPKLQRRQLKKDWMRSVLEYASSVLDPEGVVLHEAKARC